MPATTYIVTNAAAGPRTASAGSPNQPSVNAPESGMLNVSSTVITTPGASMLPVPRRIEAHMLASQIAAAPPNRTRP